MARKVVSKTMSHGLIKPGYRWRGFEVVRHMTERFLAIQNSLSYLENISDVITS